MNQPHAAQAGAPSPLAIIHPINPYGMSAAAPPTGSTFPSNPAITYHGGPVIGTPNIYIIWYGNWDQANGSDTPEGQQVVRDFLVSIGGSPYFLINSSYNLVSGQAYFLQEISDSYSRGSQLQDSDVALIVANAVTPCVSCTPRIRQVPTGRDNNSLNPATSLPPRRQITRLPYDPNGVYFVLTSSDVSEQSGFCTIYCGWHNAATPTIGHIRYAFVGNANRCLNACAIQSIGPNGNSGVDAMISVIAHELEEATTDPDLSAWYDGNGAENADKCAWTFGHSQYQTANGAFSNMFLGGRNYLIQRNLYHDLFGPNGIADYCMVDSSHN